MYLTGYTTINSKWIKALPSGQLSKGTCCLVWHQQWTVIQNFAASLSRGISRCRAANMTITRPLTLSITTDGVTTRLWTWSWHLLAKVCRWWWSNTQLTEVGHPLYANHQACSANACYGEHDGENKDLPHQDDLNTPPHPSSMGVNWLPQKRVNESLRDKTLSHKIHVRKHRCFRTQASVMSLWFISSSKGK